ncbi:plakophilin-2 [Protopterus annectens]|uniref:plakophilin-2 n=1 Tax=Protopterus annectens TaxID=7888 RepID=UPI001CFAD8A4|nr:plakophilin-2 [Protopterus annectens]
MANLATWAPEPDKPYIRTVLSGDVFRDVDSSTLAVPSDDKIRSFSQGYGNGKSIRIQEQVRLTMSRKSRKSTTSEGKSSRTYSVPDYVDYGDGSFNSSGTAAANHYNYTDASTTRFTSPGYVNGYGKQYISHGTTQLGSQQPLRRLEISSEESPKVAQHMQSGTSSFMSKRSGNTGMFQSSVWHPQNFQATVSAPRYARSDTVNFSKVEASKRGDYGTYKKQFNYQTGGGGDVFDSAPNSPLSGGLPGIPVTRSMNNVFEKENYVTYSGVRGTMKNVSNPQYMSNIQMQRFGDQQGFVMNTANTSQAASASSFGGERTQVRMPMAATGNMQFQTSRKQIFTEAHQGMAQMNGMNASHNATIQLTMEKAVQMLKSEDLNLVTSAATFIQHECFENSEPKTRVLQLGGIPKLLNLLDTNNTEVQKAACGALRNVVYEDIENKMEVHNCGGISTLLRLLKETKNPEIIKQTTGLLWNLSSIDSLKNVLTNEGLQTITQNVVVPYSGWYEGDCPKSAVNPDPEIFYNITGCLRNMSSAGPEQRRQMRDCDGLIDSLIQYSRETIADYKPDDKSVENCVCILHNLCYHLEQELPNYYVTKLYRQKQTAGAPHSKSQGCFGARSMKAKEKQEVENLIPEEKSNPKGVEWLWNSIVVRMYLSLIAKSSRTYTQEASLGTLQNLTAGDGPMPFAVAQIIVQKEKGLQHVRKLMYSNDQGVKTAALALLKNVARDPAFHKDLIRDVLPDLICTLPECSPSSNLENENVASTINCMHGLAQANVQNARAVVDRGGLKKVVDISSSDRGMITKAGRAASSFLQTMWLYKELHGTYKKSFLKKSDFINEGSRRAVVHSL